MTTARLRTISLLALIAFAFNATHAATSNTAPMSFSSSAANALPESPDAQYGQTGVPPAPKTQTPSAPRPQSLSNLKKPNAKYVRPFSTVGIAVKAGAAGIGFDVATPLTGRHLNLRGGASFLSLNHDFSEDELPYHADLQFKSAMMAVDYFPFGNALRISPILQIYNGNKISATTNVAAGGSFTLNDDTYYSSAGSPVAGSANFFLGNSTGSKVAPGVTMGFGNMIPRGKGEHWSVPFEIGFVYIEQPKFLLDLHGITCETSAEAAAQTSTTPTVAGCSSIAADTTTQFNIMQEELEINDDLKNLKFYPVFSIGLSYKF